MFFSISKRWREAHRFGCTQLSFKMRIANKEAQWVRVEASKARRPDVALEDISAAQLLDVNGNVIQAAELWKDAPCVLVVFRRPGCVMCREIAATVWRLREILQKLDVNMYGLVHEPTWKQIKQFEKFWPGPMYVDTSKTIYKTLQGGKKSSYKQYAQLLNPFSQAWKNYRRAQKSVSDGNAVGRGDVHGGLFVVRKGTAGVQFAHAEAVLGDFATSQEILEAAEEAAKYS